MSQFAQNILIFTVFIERYSYVDLHYVLQKHAQVRLEDGQINVVTKEIIYFRTPILIVGTMGINKHHNSFMPMRCIPILDIFSVASLDRNVQ